MSQLYGDRDVHPSHRCCWLLAAELAQQLEDLLLCVLDALEASLDTPQAPVDARKATLDTAQALALLREQLEDVVDVVA